jgi:hypothetical protein
MVTSENYALPFFRVKTLYLLEAIWEQNQDLRFNQLIYNLYREYSSENNQLGQVLECDSNGFVAKMAFDFFYLEDDEFIRFMEKKLKLTNSNR